MTAPTPPEHALRPCPFCDGKSDWDSKPGATGEQFWCMCANDECVFYAAHPFHTYATKADAIAAWNRRTSPTNMQTTGPLRFMDGIGARHAVEAWVEKVAQAHRDDPTLSIDRYGLRLNDPTAQPNGGIVAIWKGTQLIGVATIVRDEMNFSVLTITEHRAPPSEADVERVARAIGNTQLLIPGTLRDLLCTTTYANNHVIASLLVDIARAAIAAMEAV